MTASLPTQRRLDIRLEYTAPLMDIDAARGALELDQLEVQALIDDRKLAFAFNIAVEAAGRREVRILTRCVRGYQTTSTACGLEHERVENVIAWILARDPKPYIYGNRLRALLVCSSALVIDLIRAGQLALMPGSTFRRGRYHGTPAVTRESLIQFLKKRRMQ